jgi:pSer/pThr/pTyr-binding forkhead associated (FHA) protein
MQLKLRVLVGGSPGQKLVIPAPVFVIGRDAQCDLRPKSGYISRRHCEIAQEKGIAFVRDLRSRTGTWVNGIRIPAERAVEVQTGDHLKIGPLEFEILVRHGLGGQKKSKVETIDEAAARTAEVAAEKKAEDNIDVADWLMDDDDLPGETLGSNPSPTIMSAEDLIAQSKPADVPVATPTIDPRKAADEALRNLLRRG